MKTIRSSFKYWLHFWSKDHIASWCCRKQNLMKNVNFSVSLIITNCWPGVLPRRCIQRVRSSDAGVPPAINLVDRDARQGRRQWLDPCGVCRKQPEPVSLLRAGALPPHLQGAQRCLVHQWGNCNTGPQLRAVNYNSNGDRLNYNRRRQSDTRNLIVAITWSENLLL